MNKNKVLVGVSTARVMWGDTVQSFLDMAKYSRDMADFLVITNCEMTVARNQMVMACLQGGYKGFCIVDSDQTFPPDALDTLVGTGKEIAGYVIRCSKQDNLNFGYFTLDPYRQAAERDAPKGQLFEVDWIGMGFTYITREVIDKLKYPYFKLDYVGENNEYRLHTDFYFSLKAKEAGFKIWACSLRNIGHMAITERFP